MLDHTDLPGFGKIVKMEPIQSDEAKRALAASFPSPDY
jgi:hypothetical protein